VHPVRHLHCVCQATVAKKKTFYGMKVQTLKRKFSDICNRLSSVSDHLAQPYEARIRALYYTLKEVYYTVSVYIGINLYNTRVLYNLSEHVDIVIVS